MSRCQRRSVDRAGIQTGCVSGPFGRSPGRVSKPGQVRSAITTMIAERGFIMESKGRKEYGSVGRRTRRIAALSYFSFPLAAFWGALLVRVIGRDPYIRQHAVAALAIQLIQGIIWFLINVLVLVGLRTSVGIIGLIVVCLSILFSWICGLLALRGHPAPTFTRRRAGSE